MKASKARFSLYEFPFLGHQSICCTFPEYKSSFVSNHQSPCPAWQAPSVAFGTWQLLKLFIQSVLARVPRFFPYSNLPSPWPPLFGRRYSRLKRLSRLQITFIFFRALWRRSLSEKLLTDFLSCAGRRFFWVWKARLFCLLSLSCYASVKLWSCLCHSAFRYL